jgi:hypothetical protein
MSEEGATFRDYFAARAPWPIPDWFEPSDMPTAPFTVVHPDLWFTPSNPDNEEDSDEIRSAYYEYYDYDTDTWDDNQYAQDNGSGTHVPDYFKDMVAAYRAGYIAYLDAYEYWKKDYDKEKYFQWRWYFADSMLVERLGGDIS